MQRILVARRFISSIAQRRKYEDPEKQECAFLIEKLEKDYEDLRKMYQPIMLDSLLETINTMKEVQRNYE